MLSSEQEQVVEAFEADGNLFVTGGAGTGKSFLLNYLKRNYSDSGLVVAASTGIAAVNIGGSTIHSWAGIGLGNMPADVIIKGLLGRKMTKLRRRIQAARALAIDEISMISAELLDLLDRVFRAVRQDERPMGGLQILFFGDFLQLPPVSKEKNHEFCFNSHVWQDLGLKIFNLQEVFRQEDKKFIEILNKLRFGEVDDEVREVLSARTKAEDKKPAIKPTILTSHNYKAQNTNCSKLRDIAKKEVDFQAEFSGDARKIEFLRKNCIAFEDLRLKIGAQVMMIKNTHQKDGVINGSLGIVREFSTKKSYPVVEFDNGAVITVAREEWSIERFDETKKEAIVEASMKQIPLILSWAITIHKSQGLTLDKISCDLGQIFSPGQAYVALSRARGLGGVFIESVDFERIRADEEAVGFYRSIS